MNIKPYVGITGPVSVLETMAICEEFVEAGYTMESSHIPMLGFLVSYKTLQGQKTENRRYPPVNLLPDLLRATNQNVFTMIHYNSKELNTLSDQVIQLFDGVYDEGLCAALQLNIPWPPLDQISKIKNKFPDMKIVFQASQKVMNNQTPSQLAKDVRAYGDLLTYVLIDPSGGQGLPFDVQSSVATYYELKEHCPHLSIGFAGGFTGENVALRLQELIATIGTDDFCIDAEGGLRDKITPAYGDDLLNMLKVFYYLHSASYILP